jgi:HAE1 family hydrophobic/amphiphilic exporter-1
MRISVLLASVFGCCALLAQQAVPPRIGVGPVKKELTLQETVELALKNNLDIEIERSNRSIAQQAVEGARGYWDPRFRWVPAFDNRNTPTENALFGQDAKISNSYLNQDFHFQQPLNWNGSSVRADFVNRRTSTNNPFASLNPFITSELSFSFVQPLARNRKIDQARAQLAIRQKNADLSNIEFEVRTIDVVTRVHQAYWNLAAAREAVGVSQDSVQWGREQLERNRRQIDAGVLPPVELAASEAELERRLDTLYAVIARVTEAENELKVLIAPDRSADIWNDELIPVERQSVHGPAEIVELSQRVEEAISKRPELRALRVRQDINDVEKQQNANLVKPQVNLVASYINTGLAGSLRAVGDNPFSASQAASLSRLNELSAMAGLPPLPPPQFGSLPPSVSGGYGQTLSNMFSGNYQSAVVGLEVDFTFRNREAKSNLVQSNIVEKRLKYQQAQAEQTIVAQVRNAYQAIQSARQRMEATAASARAAKEKLDSEIRLFQSGESTNFLVLTRQNEFAESRQREVLATLEYNKAIALLDQALGQTLERNSIVLK